MYHLHGRSAVDTHSAAEMQFDRCRGSVYNTDAPKRDGKTRRRGRLCGRYGK